MTQVEFHSLSMREAEEALVEVWRCLEEYDIPAPRMIFTFEGAARVNIRLDVGEPVWADLIRWRLTSVSGANRRRAWSGRDIGGHPHRLPAGPAAGFPLIDAAIVTSYRPSSRTRARS
jgi:hypothetical protein